MVYEPSVSKETSLFFNQIYTSIMRIAYMVIMKLESFLQYFYNIVTSVSDSIMFLVVLIFVEIKH